MRVFSPEIMSTLQQQNYILDLKKFLRCKNGTDLLDHSAKYGGL